MAPKKSLTFIFATLIATSTLLACGGGGGGGSGTPNSNETDGDTSSARVNGSFSPDNGTQPSESTCRAGSYVRNAGARSDACDSEQFEIYEQNGFLAVSGFVRDDYFFFEAGEEGRDGSGKDNLLNLIGVPYGGTSNTVCLFSCRGSTMSVSCTGPGAQLCDFTDYTLAN